MKLWLSPAKLKSFAPLLASNTASPVRRCLWIITDGNFYQTDPLTAQFEQIIRLVMQRQVHVVTEGGPCCVLS